MKDKVAAIRQAVIDIKIGEIEDLVRDAVDSGENLELILNEGLISAMDVVGRMFSEGKVFVPEMMVSAMAMKKGLGVLQPYLLKGGAASSRGTLLIGTVKGDIHDIGKNLVAMMLEGAGYNVVDLGIDQPAQHFVEKVRELKPDVLGLSGLLSVTMMEMGSVIEALRDAGLRDSVKVIVGGAPVTQDFADKIGADGYGKDAAEAVKIVKALVP
jgi:corrinoid protein of di/trimethylamine methyltransferase